MMEVTTATINSNNAAVDEEAIDKAYKNLARKILDTTDSYYYNILKSYYNSMIYRDSSYTKKLRSRIEEFENDLRNSAIRKIIELFVVDSIEQYITSMHEKCVLRVMFN